MSQLFSTSVAAQDISTPKLIKTWTATASYDSLKLRVLLSGLAGNGSYQVCATVQPGGAGPIYQTPTAAGFCAATVTTLWLPSITFPIASGDVLKVYVQGLAGDTSVDGVVALWEGADVELGLTTQGYTTTRAGYLDALNGIAATINAEMVDVLRTDLIPDSVAADGVQPTIAQSLYMIWQFLSEKDVVATTLTVKKTDGSTALMVFSLDDGTNPTSITRTS